ncbi:hypothetical protein A0H81_10215 [Grifola frondosa]|uniref:MYND-type domain-containing protein n=1 Tax=Grifola frondosa TaxID=5627 RepID=A0A1C7M493_GRIFR|nr:hypothetical protein A0H81_10215 [Grifola frondosa]
MSKDEILRAARRSTQTKIVPLRHALDERLIPQDEVLDILFLHLNESRIPKSFATSMHPTIAAVQCLAAFANMDLEGDVGRIIDGWPGILKWSAYFFTETGNRRKVALQAVGICWISIMKHQAIVDAMGRSPTSIELATRMWLEEAIEPYNSAGRAPLSTHILMKFLQNSDGETVDRMLGTVGADCNKVAKFAVAKLQTSFGDTPTDPDGVVVHITFLTLLSGAGRAPLLNALLGANVNWVVTKALVEVSVLVNSQESVDAMVAMTYCFGYLHTSLEATDGFTWVSQSVGAGLLQAFCNCSPHFSKLEARDLKMVLEVVGNVVSRFLIYRSVIETVEVEMEKIDSGSLQAKRVGASVAKPVWDAFRALAHERAVLVRLFSTANTQVCDNVQCQKRANRKEFRRCSACLVTFYCSKECQKASWKEGDHKALCILQQRQRMEGKPMDISKRDIAFLQQLVVLESRRHLRYLRERARRDFPDTPYSGLVVCIDYSVLPTALSLKRLEGYEYDCPLDSENFRARNAVVIERARDYPDICTLIETTLERKRGVLALGPSVFSSGNSDAFWEVNLPGKDDRNPQGRAGELGRMYNEIKPYLDADVTFSPIGEMFGRLVYI